MRGERAYWCSRGKFYARAVFPPWEGSSWVLLSTGENLYWYTFSGGDSIPGRFFRGEVLCGGGGGNSMLQHRQKRCFYKGQSLTWARIFVVNYNIRNLLGYIQRGHISLPDHITRMKIYWQIKEKWSVIIEITAKTCITLRRYPLVLPTSGPIPRVHVLGCGLTSHFGDSNIPIVHFWPVNSFFCCPFTQKLQNYRATVQNE